LGATFLELGWLTFNAFPGWDTPRGYRLTLEHDTKECAYESTAYYGITLMHRRLHHIHCYPGYAFKTSYAFEALCGGLFYPPAERWNDPQKLEMDKALARDIVGEKKAAIAESLTPDEKAELVGFKKGFDFALDMVAKVNPEEADPYSNMVDDEQKTKMTQVFTYEAAKMLKEGAPPKAYALLFEPDERPMLCYGFAHEVFLTRGRDYTLAYMYADSAMHALWERNMADPSNKLGAQMEDPSTPLAERLAQIDAFTAADKRKDAEFKRECMQLHQQYVTEKGSRSKESPWLKRRQLLNKGHREIAIEAEAKKREQETALAGKRAAKKAKVEAEASGSD